MGPVVMSTAFLRADELLADEVVATMYRSSVPDARWPGNPGR
jgi:hypothetical protein